MEGKAVPSRLKTNRNADARTLASSTPAVWGPGFGVDFTPWLHDHPNAYPPRDVCAAAGLTPKGFIMPVDRETVLQYHLGGKVGLRITKPLNNRAPCHYCANCNRGCMTNSNFAAGEVLIFPAAKTGRLSIITNAMAREVTVDAKGNAKDAKYGKQERGLSGNRTSPIG